MKPPTMRPMKKLSIGALSILLLLGGLRASAQTGTIAPSPFLPVLDNSGHIINAACVWTYVAGTTTLATTYTTKSGGVANANPILTDSAGRFTAFLIPGNSYKFVYENIPCSASSHGTVLRTADGIDAVPLSAATVDITGTAGETITAGLAVYLSDGSGSKNAGQWYKADSANTYSSTTNWVGVAPSAIASGTSGTIRLAGSVTGLSALSVGSVYYVGTAGAITSTAPANARKVGQADTTTSLVVTADPPITPVASPANLVEGRLTLTSNTPVTVGDVTGATSIFFTPYAGNRIALYDGTTWNVRTFSQITIALGTLTSALPYDLFAYDNAGTVAFDSPVAWTSDTARATALTTQDGVLVKTGATTRRYIGTFRTTSTTQTEDSVAKRFLWNYYNRAIRPMRVLEATATWTYSSTFQQANASTANQLDFVIGWAEDQVHAQVLSSVISSGATFRAVDVAIGLDSTTSPATGCIYTRQAVNNTFNVSTIATLDSMIAVGRHILVWLEAGGSADTQTWTGAGGAIGQSGISGWIKG
jgi:hypothetical protein